MSELMLAEPVELTDAELDLVTGGALATGGLVNIALSDTNINLLNGFNIDVTAPITISNVANNNHVSVGAIIQVLGGGAAILQHQA
jgi:hypothetical protein